MKSDLIAKHLLADHSCKNCNHCTTHKMVTLVENPVASEVYDYGDQGHAYKTYNIDKCAHDIKPKLGVCKKWEKIVISEGMVWGDLMPVYTTHIFEEEDDD